MDKFIFIADNIFHLDVHYVCYIMLVQRIETILNLQISIIIIVVVVIIVIVQVGVVDGWRVGYLYKIIRFA